MINFILFKTAAQNFPVKVGLNEESTKAKVQEKLKNNKKLSQLPSKTAKY